MADDGEWKVQAFFFFLALRQVTSVVSDPLERHEIYLQSEQDVFNAYNYCPQEMQVSVTWLKDLKMMPT